MKETEAIKKLSELAKFRELINNFKQEQDELEDEVFLLHPDLNQRRLEISTATVQLLEKAAGLNKEIIEAVLGKGESIKGEELQAIFSKGRVTWDSKKLEGFALAHPELDKLKKTGKPSVSIREVKDKKQS